MFTSIFHLSVTLTTLASKSKNLLANAGSVTDSPLGTGIQFLLLLANAGSVTDNPLGSGYPVFTLTR
jgi:hypothetical protein